MILMLNENLRKEAKSRRKKVQNFVKEITPIIKDAFADISSEWETKKIQITSKYSIEIEADKLTDFDDSGDKDETDRLAWEAALKDPNETWPTYGIMIMVVDNNGNVEDACTSYDEIMAIEDLKYLLKCYI